MSRRVAFVLIALTLALTACGQGGTSTSCGVNGCAVTFPRSGDTAVSVLGVEARLLGVQNNTAELMVAGQRVSVPVGTQTEAGGFTVGVESLTATEVVVRVRL